MTTATLSKPGNGKLREEDRPEFASRLARVRQLMTRDGFDALLVADAAGILPPGGNTRYLSNFVIRGHDTSADNHVALVLPLEGEPTLVVPAGPHASLLGVARATSFVDRVVASPPTGWPPQGHVIDDVISSLRAAGLDGRRIGICGELPGLDRIRAALPGTTFEPAVKRDARGIDRDIVERVRMVKSAWEIERMRAAQRCADAGLAAFFRTVAPGQTYNRATAEAEYVARCMGAESALTIFSGGGRDPFTWWYDGGIDREFASGDLVAIEFNAVVEGYFAQICRSATVGPARPEQLRVIDAATRALETMRAAARPGVTGDQLWEIGLREVRQMGLEPFGRFGHGMGLTMAEGVDVLSGDDNQLGEGYCLELHSGAQDKGRKLASKVGDQIIVTKSGAEDLSSGRMPYSLSTGPS